MSEGRDNPPPLDADPLADPINQYALILAQSTDPAEREAAAQALMPILTRLSKRVARQFGGHRMQWLTEDVYGLCLERVEKYNPEKGSFEAWMRQVLDRHVRDQIRRHSRDAIGHAQTGQTGDDQATIIEAVEDDFHPSLVEEPLSQADLDRLERWNAVPRLIMLTLCGRWNRIPPAQWNRWVEEAGLRAPFPPPAFLDTTGTSKRYSMLSEWLGISNNAISTHLHRYRDKLRQLDDFQPPVD